MVSSEALNVAELRVSGPDAEVEELKARVGLELDASWKKGESRLGGRLQESAGFNACVGECKSPGALMDAVRCFLARARGTGLSFEGSGLEAQLDLGIGVGTSDQFAAGLAVSIEDMQQLIELGLKLVVTAYPVSGESGGNVT